MITLFFHLNLQRGGKRQKYSAPAHAIAVLAPDEFWYRQQAQYTA